MALRVTGLYSGLDIDQLVADLMKIERRPVDVRIQSKSRLQAQLDAWRDLNSKLYALQQKLSDLQSTATWDKLAVTSSNTGALTAAMTGTPAAGTYTVTVNQLAQNRVYRGDPANKVADPNTPLTFGTSPTTVRIVDRTGTERGRFDITDGMSLNSIASTINGISGLNVTATVAEVSPGDFRLVISETRTGADYDFTFDQIAGSAWTDLGFLNPDGTMKASASVQAPQNAALTVNGIRYERSTNVFDGVIGGLRLTATGTGTSTVTVAQDTDSLVNAIKAMVDAYNAFADAVNKYTKYDPGTKESGVLQGDITATQLLASVRRNLTDDVLGLQATLNNLSQIGITTEPFSSGNIKAGRLTLDETKLRDKLTTDPSGVEQLFNGASGVATRSLAYIQPYTQTGGILPKQEESLEASIDRLQDSIDYWEEVILPKREENLRQKFTRLELALQEYQSQSQWLAQQLAALPTWSVR